MPKLSVPFAQQLVSLVRSHICHLYECVLKGALCVTVPLATWSWETQKIPPRTKSASHLVSTPMTTVTSTSIWK